MKTILRISTACGLALFIWITFTQSLEAVTLTYEPENIELRAFRRRRQPITRHITINASTNITSVTAISQDLLRSDHWAVFPAAQIELPTKTFTVSVGQPHALPVTFDFRGVPSGEYAGQLLLSHPDGSFNIPIVIKIKDQWAYPLYAVLIGAILGIGMTAYRQNIKPKDELLVRIGRVRAGITNDGEISDPFKTAINAHMLDAEFLILQESWEDAAKKMDEAETVWRKWLKRRLAWIDQYAFTDALLDRPELKSSKAIFPTQLKDRLNLYRESGPQGTLPEFRENIQSIRDHLNLYLRWGTELDLLKEADPQIEKNAQYVKVRDLRLTISPFNSEDLKSFEAELQKLRESLAPSDQTEASGKRSSLSITRIIDRVDPVPMLDGTTASDSPRQAAGRIRWFKWFGYGFAVIVLAGLGFGQLYVSDPTFGDTPWNDYSSLILWGFAAEASRDSITKFLKGLDIIDLGSN